MTLPPGTRIGPYTVVAKLGEGGMGEVYRARDTTLDRDVALKILPDSFSSDPDRLMRFEREAKTLAALNHPNIAAIYGIADSASHPQGPESGARPTRALVMEFVDGLDLSQRIAAGAMPVDDVLPVTRQIVDALEAAHEAGIVHRDLKPANIKLKTDGTVKVLDFGLAKATDPAAGDSGLRSNVANSPTMTSPALTQMGVILGTAAYMSPEQAKGRAVDKRADIWAFGVVVYEMLAGRRAFVGEDVSDLLVAVLSKDADLSALPAGTPHPLVTLIRRCLERDPRKRLRDIGDARHLLDEAAAPATDVPAAAAPAAAHRSRVLLPVLATVAVLATAVAAWLMLSAATPAVPVYLSVALPDGHALLSGPAISRDGQQVAFVSSDGASRPQLYVRRLDEPDSRLIAGTEDAVNPFFSPDGRHVAFYGRYALFKVNLAGGAPTRLADSNSNTGGTWLDDGRIVFKPSWNGGLFVVSENGGEATVLIEPNQPNEYAYVWPLARPGSRSLIFAAWGDTFQLRRLDLETRSQSVLVGGWRKSALAGDLLVFGGGAGELRAISLDGSADAVPVTVAEGVDLGPNNGSARFDISETGTLAYSSADRRQRVLAIVDMAGRPTVTAGGEADYTDLSLSPDGRRMAIRADGSVGIVDVERGAVTPLTPELRSGSQDSPLWQDANWIVFSSNHQGNWDIYRRQATGAGDIERVLERPLDQRPVSMAPDGTLLFEESTVSNGNDLWLLPRSGAAVPWLATSAEEGDGQFSPDGLLVAYTSNATGRTQVYVQPRTQDGSRVQVSIDGGTIPAWSPSGDRLYFRHNNAMMVATISTRGGLAAGTPLLLFDGGWALSGNDYFKVRSDGKSFLMILRRPAAIPTRIDLILNWFTELTRRYNAR